MFLHKNTSRQTKTGNITARRSTKHLFRWAPPESRNSTPIATRPVQAIRIRASTQGGQLQEVDRDQLDKILAGTVAKGGVALEKRFIQQLQKLFAANVTVKLPVQE